MIANLFLPTVAGFGRSGVTFVSTKPTLRNSAFMLSDMKSTDNLLFTDSVQYINRFVGSSGVGSGSDTFDWNLLESSSS